MYLQVTVCESCTEEAGGVLSVERERRKGRNTHSIVKQADGMMTSTEA